MTSNMDKNLPPLASCPKDTRVNIHILTSADYARVRESIGSQRDVAQRLGVDIRTVQRREAGEILITQECCRALCALSAIAAVRQLGAKIADMGFAQELDDIVTLLEVQ